MAEIIENVTFLRFDYPYDTKFARRHKVQTIFEYDKIYEELINVYVPFVRIYYKPIEKKSEPKFIVNDAHFAKIDKIKYNKIIGSFDIDNFLNNRNFFGDTVSDDIIDSIVDLFKKRRFDENCYLNTSIYGYNEKHININTLIVNLTKRNMKNFI